MKKTTRRFPTTPRVPKFSNSNHTNQNFKPRKPKLNPSQADPSIVAQPTNSATALTDSSILLSPLERAKALIFSRISASLISIANLGEDEDAGEAEEKLLVPFVMHPSWPGRPIVAMDQDERHCQNLIQETKCAFTVCFIRSGSFFRLVVCLLVLILFDCFVEKISFFRLFDIVSEVLVSLAHTESPGLQQASSPAR
jgi:hypothetical protein